MVAASACTGISNRVLKVIGIAVAVLALVVAAASLIEY